MASIVSLAITSYGVHARVTRLERRRAEHFVTPFVTNFNENTEQVSRKSHILANVSKNWSVLRFSAKVLICKTVMLFGSVAKLVDEIVILQLDGGAGTVTINLFVTTILELLLSILSVRVAFKGYRQRYNPYLQSQDSLVLQY